MTDSNTTFKPFGKKTFLSGLNSWVNRQELPSWRTHLWAFCVTLTACSRPPQEPQAPDHPVIPSTKTGVAKSQIKAKPKVSPEPQLEPQSPAFSCPSVTSVEPRPIIDNPFLPEISGVVSGRTAKQYLWVHNDSGDSPRFFAIDDTGQLSATFLLPPTVTAVDIEDVSWREHNGQSYLIFADTGDNQRDRKSVSLYLVKEPQIEALLSGGASVSSDDFVEETLTFPDHPEDVEAFFSDPRSGQLIFLTKNRTQPPTIYIAETPSESGILRWAGKMQSHAEERLIDAVTAADISEDGKWIIIRTYLSVFLFHRSDSENVEDALRKNPCAYDIKPESQGEAIGFFYSEPWVAQGEPRPMSGFVTISEGNPSQINRYDLKQP